MPVHRFNLGDRVKDTVTGYTGITVARSEWINGTISYGVVSQTLIDGKPIEPQWFNEGQLDLIEENSVIHR